VKVEIKIPEMGESVTQATISAILEAEGSFVEEGAEIIELETEKVNQVLYAPQAGVIHWSVSEEDTVSIGDLIGFVDTDAKAPEKSVTKEPAPKVEKEAPAVKEPPKKTEGKQVRLGQSEFVGKLDKKRAPTPISTPTTSKEDAAPLIRRKMSNIRKTIASRLVESLHSSAMLTTFNEVDMSAVMAMRAKYKEKFTEKHGVKLGFMSFFVKAVVEALKDFPDLNSYIDGEDIVTRTTHDIGIAVGTERGLVVPVVRACEEMTFAEIEKAIVEYAQAARNKKLKLEDLANGGFTITNGGIYGSLLSTPILNPPQVGILGMHAIVKRPVAINDAVEIRPMMYLALSYDHRIVDGKEAVSFLVRVREVLEDPARLMFIDTDL